MTEPIDIEENRYIEQAASKLVPCTLTIVFPVKCFDNFISVDKVAFVFIVVLYVF